MPCKKKKENCGSAKRNFNNLWLCIKEKSKLLLACDERALRCNVILAIGCYILLLFWALWLKFNDFHMVVPNYRWLSTLTLKERFLYDLIPFQIRFDFKNQFIQILANGVVFAPFGVLLNYLFQKKNIWRDLAICFGVSLCIETIQLFTIIGNFATVDLIMNTAGYFIGLAGYVLIFKRFSLCTSVWFYRVVNLIVVPLFVWAVITTVNNWDQIIAILTRTL